jgi:nitroreductase
MESNPVLAAIQGRRTLRNYTSGEVGKELLLSVLEAGRWAPSGKNGQPWRFIVIGDREIKEALSQCTRYASIIAQAPVAIVVFLDSQ